MTKTMMMTTATRPTHGRCALYVRKSTSQDGVHEDLTSVARQKAHGRAYAERHGWTVGDEYIFEDDGISGAEFANRPGFVRLMNALKPRPPFQMLVMSEESRLGREAIETAYALKQLVTAGVRVFFYLEDRERTLGTATDKVLLSVTAFADELEREKARQRTYDALVAKHHRGHVTGGRVFGYTNVPVLDAAGEQTHVLRAIDPKEAAIVQRIFTMSAAGDGFARIAKRLNGEGVPGPRPTTRRVAGWSPSSIRDVLRRDLYRGLVTYGKTKKRDPWGQRHQIARPEADWLTRTQPDLRIVSDPLWRTAQTRLAKRRLTYSTGPRTRVARDYESPYLLSGFATCATCGGALCVVTRKASAGRRQPFYGCLRQQKTHGCPNALVLPVAVVDDAVVTALLGQTLRPAVVRAVVGTVLDALAPKEAAITVRRLTKDLARLDVELKRLTNAIAAGGSLPSLVAALTERTREREQTVMALAAAEHVTTLRVDRAKIEQRVLQKLTTWRDLLIGRHVGRGREVLKTLLDGRLSFVPDGPQYRFTGRLSTDRLLDGAVHALVTSPPGIEPGSRP